MKTIKFLTFSEVLLILEDQIRNYGGIYGIRDRNLLVPHYICLNQVLMENIYTKQFRQWQ